MLYLQSPILKILPEEVILYIDVLGPECILGALVSSTASWLSSNILHQMMGVSTSLIIPFLAASLASERTGRTSHTAHDKTVYSASVVEREISV
jgi:hypothetical protein